MSLVLEALQKQEAGNDPAAAVSLARAGARRQRQRLWVGLFVVAMAINVALAAWLWLRPSVLVPPADPAIAEPVRQAVTPTPATAAPSGDAELAELPRATRPATDVPATSTPAATPVTPPAPRPVVAATPPRPQPRPQPVTLDALPADVRAAFPGLAFSTHIYSEDADLRAVVANGERLTEGDRLRGLEVVEITAEGVVLAFRRYHVLVPLNLDWDAEP